MLNCFWFQTIKKIAAQIERRNKVNHELDLKDKILKPYSEILDYYFPYVVALLWLHINRCLAALKLYSLFFSWGKDCYYHGVNYCWFSHWLLDNPFGSGDPY